METFFGQLQYIFDHADDVIALAEQFVEQGFTQEDAIFKAIEIVLFGA